MHPVMDREVNGSNPGGVKCFSTLLSFGSNSSDISWFINSRPRLLSRLLLRSYFFFTSSNFFSLYHFAAYSAFCVKSFFFSRLVSLFSHSAKSEFEHQLLSKAIQIEQSQNKQLKSEIETG